MTAARDYDLDALAAVYLAAREAHLEAVRAVLAGDPCDSDRGALVAARARHAAARESARNELLTAVRAHARRTGEALPWRRNDTDDERADAVARVFAAR